MKKFLLIAAALFCTTVAVSAQDMAQALETYNNGAMALQMGDNQGALDAFNSALTMAQACSEEEALDIIAQCKGIIPQLMLQIGKEKINAKDYEGAMAQLIEAGKKAKEYENVEVATEIAELIPQIQMQKANALLNDKNFAEAAEAYKLIIANDPDNGTAILRLGQALGAAGKVNDAVEAYKLAAEKGFAEDANKQLSKLFVKRAAAQLKAKKYTEAVADALTSNNYQENATAMKIAGTAASQLKDNENAVKYLESYLQLSPNARDAAAMSYTIAVLSQTMGNKTKAIEYYSKLLSDPKFGPTAKAQIEALSK